MRLAAIEIDLVGEIDRLLGTGGDTCVAARVPRSRSIRFYCVQVTSNAPSRPEDLRDRSRIHREFARSRKLGAGRHGPRRGPSRRDGRKGARPMERRFRRADDDQQAAFGAGTRLAARARARAAPRARAALAIFGVAPRASADQPPVSRMLTKTGSSARCPPPPRRRRRARASCVQATTTSPAASPAERRELLLAEHRADGGARAGGRARAPVHSRVERHRAVARAEMETPILDAHLCTLALRASTRRAIPAPWDSPAALIDATPWDRLEGRGRDDSASVSTSSLSCRRGRRKKLALLNRRGRVGPFTFAGQIVRQRIPAPPATTFRGGTAALRRWARPPRIPVP